MTSKKYLESKINESELTQAQKKIALSIVVTPMNMIEQKDRHDLFIAINKINEILLERKSQDEKPS